MVEFIPEAYSANSSGQSSNVKTVFVNSIKVKTKSK